MTVVMRKRCHHGEAGEKNEDDHMSTSLGVHDQLSEGGVGCFRFFRLFVFCLFLIVARGPIIFVLVISIVSVS